MLHPILWWALVYFIVAVCAYVLGAKGIGGLNAHMGRILLFVFMVLAILFAIIGFLSSKP